MPRSLQARMLLLSAVATVVALALAGLFIASVLERFVVEGLDRRLDAEITLLASAVDGDGRVDRARLAQRLGALEHGRGWRWRIAGPDGTIGSADFPALDDALPRPPGAPPRDRGPIGPLADADHGPRPAEGHEGDTRVHARQLAIATARGRVLLIAAAPRDVVRRPIRGAVAPLLAALAALAVLLTTAVLVQLRLGFRPVRRLRVEVAAIRAGARRRVGEDQPDEQRPLAAELNALAAENEAALGAARGSSANLAHALKTPVATLAIELRDQPHLAAQLARIDATIRHHLARARTQMADQRTATALRPALDDVANAVRRLHPDKTVAIDIDDAALAVALDGNDLAELIGNLLDNAARHARRGVSVTAQRDGRWISVGIADDGPGIAAADRARALQPGTRLDERGDGHGFGLAIADELVSVYGGRINLDDAREGGLLVRLTLPAAAGPDIVGST